MLRLGYNTNGLAHHRVEDALVVCARLGYSAVSITPDAGLLDPFALDARQVERVGALARELGLALTVETGARFLLDPFRKHRPSLLEDEPAERAHRLDFLLRSLQLAAALDAEVLSFWAGRAPDDAIGDGPVASAQADACERAWERLADGTRALLRAAREVGVRLAFEPEPGMFVERPAGYDELRRRLGGEGDALGLCLDVGHCLVTGDLPVSAVVRAHADALALVHLDDILTGVHEHRMFGEGDLDLADALGSLLEVGFEGIAAVELPRDAHRGPSVAEEALGRLRTALAGLTGGKGARIG